MSHDETLCTVHVVVDYYSEGETFVKSETQGLTFIRIRFSNLKPYTKRWFTIGIALTSRSISSIISGKRQRQLKLQ